MTTATATEVQDLAYAARQRFNDGIGAQLDLDAQPVHKGDLDETVVFTSGGDFPQEVTTLANLTDLADFAELLEGMDRFEVHHHIADLIIEAGEREARRWSSAGWPPIETVTVALEGASK